MPSTNEEIDPEVRKQWEREIQESKSIRRSFERRFQAKHARGKLFNNVGIPVIKWISLVLMVAFVTVGVFQILSSVEISGNAYQVKWFGIMALASLLSVLHFFAIGKKRGVEKFRAEKQFKKDSDYWTGILVAGYFLGVIAAIKLV